MKNTLHYFEKYLKFLHSHDLYPSIHEVTGLSCEPYVTIGSKKLLSFSSNNYLGLANSKEAREAVKEALEMYGVGSGSTRLLAGTLDVQIELEKALSDFFGLEDTVTFSSGYLANVGVIRMLVDPFPYFQLFGEYEGVILSDELNHASIIDGARLAKAKREKYPHSNIGALEKLLQDYKRHRKLILTDGVFSMDGDLARLREIGELAEKYDALLMVDDSHGIGVLGPNGEGTAHEVGAEKYVDVLMGSFTKAFGSIGGFISSSKVLADYLRITARSFIFSDPIPPALAAGLIVQTKMIRNGAHLRARALAASARLRDGLRGLGFTVLGDATTIVPLFVGNEKKAIKFSAQLLEKNILVPCIRRPAVVEGKERLRFSVTALHENQHIDDLLGACAEVGRALGLR